MFIPQSMQMDGGSQQLDSFIAQNGFAVLVSSDLQSTHLPLTYAVEEGPNGTLYGHMAKANPHWKSLEGERVLVVFAGPHSYISPNFYATKPAVPTWNYAAVHCYGKVELLTHEETLDSMNSLVSQYEPGLHSQPDIMPEEYKQKLSQGVVGFRVQLDEIQAKEKLGQHKPADDQKGVYKALNETKHPDSLALATYMSDRNKGIGS
jgi:transcriptional regulator